MFLHRFPGAAGGDTHGLVVVANGASGSKRIAEPEPSSKCQFIGDVAECGGALVGRHHEVAVITIVAHGEFRWHHCGAHQIVGEFEQRLDEQAVARHHLVLHGLAVGEGPADHEATLGSGGHDDGILHRLGLHETEDFGTEIFRPLRPPDTAPSYGAHTEMDALHQW